MHATILHECRRRIRLRLKQKSMTLRQADLLEEWLSGRPWALRAACPRAHPLRDPVLFRPPLGDAGGSAPVLLAGGRADRHPARPQQPGAEPGI